MYEWGLRNREHFNYFRADIGELHGCLMPYRFVKHLNDQLRIDLSIFCHGIELIKWGQLYVVEKEYPMHTDPRRDASLNFLISGESVTMWDDGTTCPYVKGQAMLFNTQVPHGVFVKPSDEPRMMASFTVTMGFPRFVNLYREGFMFEYRDILRNSTERRPS